MPTLVKIFLALLLCAASNSVFATTVREKTICKNDPVPSGWVIVNKTWNRGSCGNPATPQGNVWWIDEFDNLPVGTPLTICAFSSSVPSGWVPTSLQWNPSVCGAQYSTQSLPFNTYTIRYVVCTNEANSLCYPSLSQFAVISALPKTVNIPYGQSSGSSVISWYSPVSVCIWVNDGGATNQLWACSGNDGTQTWPYVAPGVSQTFMVSPSATSATPVLASVVVKGVEGIAPKIFASPVVVKVPAGQAFGSTKITYNLSGSNYPAMCVWVSNNGGAAQLWACGVGTTFSQVWPYVPKGGTSTIWLNPSHTSPSQILAAVTVTGN